MVIGAGWQYQGLMYYCSPVESNVPTKHVPEELNKAVCNVEERCREIRGGSDIWIRAINEKERERV